MASSFSHRTFTDGSYAFYFDLDGRERGSAIHSTREIDGIGDSVSWPSLGSVPVEKAEEFAKGILTLCERIRAGAPSLPS
jgi:hypothetical protein